MFEVIQVEGVGAFIFATCGTVGLHTRIIKLGDDELAAVIKTGEEALWPLAAEIFDGQHADREYGDERQNIYGRAQR